MSVRPINVIRGKTLVHIEDDETREGLFSIPLKHAAYADFLYDVTHGKETAHRFGAPPVPVINPSEAWCDAYADWYHQGNA